MYSKKSIGICALLIFIWQVGHSLAMEQLAAASAIGIPNPFPAPPEGKIVERSPTQPGVQDRIVNLVLSQLAQQGANVPVSSGGKFPPMIIIVPGKDGEASQYDFSGQGQEGSEGSTDASQSESKLGFQHYRYGAKKFNSLGSGYQSRFDLASDPIITNSAEIADHFKKTNSKTIKGEFKVSMKYDLPDLNPEQFFYYQPPPDVAPVPEMRQFPSNNFCAPEIYPQFEKYQEPMQQEPSAMIIKPENVQQPSPIMFNSVKHVSEMPPSSAIVTGAAVAEMDPSTSVIIQKQTVPEASLIITPKEVTILPSSTHVEAEPVSSKVIGDQEIYPAILVNRETVAAPSRILFNQKKVLTAAPSVYINPARVPSAMPIGWYQENLPLQMQYQDFGKNWQQNKAMSNSNNFGFNGFYNGFQYPSYSPQRQFYQGSTSPYYHYNFNGDPRFGFEKNKHRLHQSRLYQSFDDPRID